MGFGYKYLTKCATNEDVVSILCLLTTGSPLAYLYLCLCKSGACVLFKTAVNPTALWCCCWSLWIWEETIVQLTSAHYLIWICENSIEAPRCCLFSVHFPLCSCFENHSVSFGLICADKARLKAWSEVSPHRLISASFRALNWTEFFWESTVYIVLVDYRQTWVYFSVRQVVELSCLFLTTSPNQCFLGETDKHSTFSIWLKKPG